MNIIDLLISQLLYLMIVKYRSIISNANSKMNTETGKRVIDL